MVISSSEVNMTSKCNYTRFTKSDIQVSYTPVLNFGGFSLVKDGEKAGNNTANDNSTGFKVKDDGENFLSSFNYCVNKKGQVEETNNGRSFPDATLNVRLGTMSYLLRLLLGKLVGEDDPLASIFNQAFENTENYLVTATTSYEYSESQEVSFSSTGTVITEDGRELSFNYSFEMSSSFKERFEETCQQMQKISLTDPLVINLDSNPGYIPDQKFFFDIDADGTEDEISMLGPGAGFLALDLNEDGVINDGSELFGTKSGDGFKDLSVYDEDGNGWIDENDSIFSKLRIWTMDEQGNPQIYGLKQKDVGAIYLGRVNTDFTSYNDNHETQGVVRKSGIFLRESTGSVGSIQHIDLAR